jgi:ABC-type glycerol-3-phosphate transport system substrate-binding protein
MAAGMYRHSRRGIASCVAAALAGPLLAACAGGRDGATAGGTASPVSLSFWYNATPPDVAVPAFQQMASEYQAKRPNVQVSLEVLTGSTTDQEQKLVAAAAADSVPDVTYVHPISNATVAVRGITTSLDPYLAKNRGPVDLRDFYPGAIDYFRWDGKLWALPNYSGPGVFYYNKDLLLRLGLADPWELYQKGQWTIQQMDGYVSKLTTGQGETKVFGRHDLSRSIRVQSPWIQGFGGEVWNA